MIQFDVKAERDLNGNRFFIRPFAAFTAANISGDVSSLIMPILSSIVPVTGRAAESKGEAASLLDINVEDAAPALASGLSAISGDKVESLLKKLLVKHGNISVTREGEDNNERLTEDLANELFCGNAQDMFILAFDVIKANYSGFFEKLGIQSGEAIAALIQKPKPSPKNTAS